MSEFEVYNRIQIPGKKGTIVKIVGNYGLVLFDGEDEEKLVNLASPDVFKLKTMRIKMAYCYVGETFIDVPADMNFDEAVEYAQENIDDIPVAEHTEYIPYSDNFEPEDCSFI